MEVRDRATSGWVVSLDFPNSRDVIAPKYFDNGMVAPGSHEPFIPTREIKEWRTSDQVLKLKNGSIIGFKSADAPAGKLQGAGKDWIHFDEVPPKEHFDEAVMRVEAGRSLQIIGTATLLPPVGQRGGVSWVYEDIIKPWQKGKRKDVIIISAGIRDNPHIGRDEVRVLESVFPPGSKQHDIRIAGKLIPGLGGALAYHSFDHDLHIQDLEPPSPNIPLAWCWDFNVAPMITLMGQCIGGKFYVYRELILEEGNIPEMCEYFMNTLDTLNIRAPVYIYADATGTNRNSQTGDTDFRVIQNSIVRYGTQFRMRVKPKNPPVSSRLQAVNRALKNEWGEANVVIDRQCSEVISDMEGVLMDVIGGIKKSKNTQEPYYRRTHASDALGYWIEFEAPVKRLIDAFRQRVSAIKQPQYGFGQ
jgi:phage terminase large subunit-like protein